MFLPMWRSLRGKLHPTQLGNITDGRFADGLEELEARSRDLEELAVAAGVADITAVEEFVEGAVPRGDALGCLRLDQLLAIGLDAQKGSDLDPADVGLEIVTRLAQNRLGARRKRSG